MTRKITGADVVLALKARKLSTSAKALAGILDTDSRAVATALRKPCADGRVSFVYRKGIAYYRFKRLSATA